MTYRSLAIIHRKPYKAPKIRNRRWLRLYDRLSGKRFISWAHLAGMDAIAPGDLEEGLWLYNRIKLRLSATDALNAFPYWMQVIAVHFRPIVLRNLLEYEIRLGGLEKEPCKIEDCPKCSGQGGFGSKCVGKFVDAMLKSSAISRVPVHIDTEESLAVERRALPGGYSVKAMSASASYWSKSLNTIFNRK